MLHEVQYGVVLQRSTESDNEKKQSFQFQSVLIEEMGFDSLTARGTFREENLRLELHTFAAIA